ncbi:fungal hydrophobin [Rickenella mellea]|uniref:Hydrophobin n=1 Tax=Rickenella mellea TaxID=50990 RepID=A0A4Y7PYJ4_9AGAM|nr:fungal hydrophobin [Rickenella mellea]
MFSKLAIIASLAALVASVPAPHGGECNSGPVQCCNSLSTAGDPAFADQLGLLGINIQDPNVPIGVTCTPVTVFGIQGGSSSCNGETVCCDTEGNGGIAVGCVPVNANA